LNIVPIQFYRENDTELFKADLVERGKQYETYVTRPASDLHWHYKGRFIAGEEDTRDVQVRSYS
jgi:hypothetical protein